MLTNKRLPTYAKPTAFSNNSLKIKSSQMMPHLLTTAKDSENAS